MKRESNFDLLRIISSVAVIFIHVSSDYVNWLSGGDVYGKEIHYSGGGELTFLLDTLPRFAVPCFVMLSGAFILSNPNNANRKYFYKKTVKNTVITTLIFSVLYMLYSMLKGMMGELAGNNDGIMTILKPLHSALIGMPFPHMWYLYMIFGLYLVTPYVIRGSALLAEDGIDLYGKPAWVFLAFASVSYWTSTFKLGWDIGLQFRYLSYYLVGCSIFRYSKEHKSNSKGLTLITIGIVIETALAVFRYLVFTGEINVSWTSNEIFAYEGLDPCIVISAVPIFAGFALLDIKRDFSGLSSYTFLIYLFHYGIWDVMRFMVVCRIPFFQSSNFAIPICVMSVFCLSFLAAYIYRLLWNKFDRRFAITAKVLAALKLTD